MTKSLASWVLGKWHVGSGKPKALHDATTEAVVALVDSTGIDFEAVASYARDVGGPALRNMTFAERGAMLAAAAAAIHAHREELLDISAANAGTTRSDGKFDIDGATGTLAAYAQMAAEGGDRTFLTDGDGLALGRTARFWGQHIYVPRRGVAVHINAFNFPAWNMLEKAACAWLAGVPVIEKPGTPTAMVAARVAEVLAGCEALPAGAFQFVAGSTGDLLDRLQGQDAVAFTGSSDTALALRSNANLLRRSVRFNAEADSLNAAVLGPDVEEGDETWRLFIRNVVLDVRQKTGQKCTAVRRVLVPEALMGDVSAALVAALAGVVVGDPRAETTTMGPLASASQLRDVRVGIARLQGVTRTLCGGPEPVHERGWFVRPTLLQAARGDVDEVHEHEVFGPVATLLPYDGTPEEAARIVVRGGGSLVGSIYSDDANWAERAIRSMAPWHGRLWLGSEKMAEQSVAPGTVLPAMVHGGPGRAGGGEELGGLRGVRFYMQRVALQGYKGVLDPVFGPASARRAEPV